MHELRFKQWLGQQESTAFTRRRNAAALGLAPPIPDASKHSHSTFPWEEEKPRKKKKKKKRKKLDEAKRRVKPDRSIDNWIKEIEGLKPDLAQLKSAIEKRKEAEKKKEKKTSTNEKPNVKDDNDATKGQLDDQNSEGEDPSQDGRRRTDSVKKEDA